MLDMFLNSVSLFLRGKLFQEPGKVMRQTVIGMAGAILLLVIMVKAGLALWLAVVLTGLIAGAMQPWLFKDLKYR